MRMKLLALLLVLACAVLFGLGLPPEPAIPASTYVSPGYSGAEMLLRLAQSLGPPLPDAVLLDVPTVYQWPEMPNGCEATALTMLLQYYGLPADKLEIAYTYIPRSDFTFTWFATYGPDPEYAYAGDPALFGFYCLAPAVVQGANTYLAEQESTLCARNMSGADTYVLQRLLAQGQPVVFWATIDFAPVEYSDYTWKLYSNGSDYHPYRNLHCLVLCGYDADCFYVMDPLTGLQAIERDTFMLRYDAMERRAVALWPDDDPGGSLA